ncbi:hypothetical protein [Streptomyces tuirus]
MLPGTSPNATVLDSATRDRTRVLLLFSLSGRLHPRDTALGALADRYDYGRFASHLMTSQDVLPVPVLTGWVLLRRVRTRSGSLLPAPEDTFAPVPPPRSPSGNRRP